MDLEVLRMFRAVVDEGGISSAAKKLHRVQSNVTTRIQQLEDSLGTKLFLRHKRRLHLSTDGEVFLAYVDQLLAIAEQARHAMQGDSPRGVLRIGTLESTAASRLPPLLSRYHESFPAVRVELMTGTTDALIEAVTTRRVAAAFVADCAAAPQLEAISAFEEELVLATPRSHPQVRRAQDVRADTIISFPSGCAYRRRLQTWLRGAEVTPEKVLELSSYHAIVACVASGTGIAFVPRSVLETIRAPEKGISIYPLPAKIAKATTSLVYRAGELSLALRALRTKSSSSGRLQGKRTK